MRITPINIFSNNVSNSQNSQKYASPIMNNQLSADTVQFKGRMFNTQEASRIGEALTPLRDFMNETRPLYVKVLTLKKNVSELIAKHENIAFIDGTKFDKQKAETIKQAAEHYMNLIPYKKATTIASEADAHIVRINDTKLMDLPEQEIFDLQKKTLEINGKIDALDKDKKNFPLINEDVNNFLEVNKDLDNVLFS